MVDKAKKRLFGGIAIFLGFILGIAMLEIAAIAYVVVKEGRYLSAQELFHRDQNLFIEQVSTAKSSCRYIDSLFPHPYLGFVHHGNPPCGIPHINNIGLFGENFPVQKRDDRFVVLLTGGSVAAQLGQILGPEKPRYLEEALNAQYVSPNGKPFLVLNGGDGAWKQPQQLILFLMHGDFVNAVVTLDGFNEHYGLTGKMRFEYPANNFMLANPLANYNFGQLVGAWLVGKIAGALRENVILGHSHLAYYVVHAVDKWVKRAETPEDEQRTTIESLFSLPASWDENKRFAWQFKRYHSYIISMDAVAKSQGVISAHFIQPVPAIGKQLTEKERAVVGGLDYRDVYRRMTDKLLALQKQNVEIFSLLDIFANERDTLYQDPIHLKIDADGESRGYRIMADRMAEDLGKAWRLRSKPR